MDPSGAAGLDRCSGQPRLMGIFQPSDTRGQIRDDDGENAVLVNGAHLVDIRVTGQPVGAAEAAVGALGETR